MPQQHFSLLQLNSLVRDILDASLPDSYWVEAELSEAREAYGGHCYMELIQKDERSNTPVAKAHAACWRNRWQLLRPHFERTTGQYLHAGMKVLLKVHAQFHENYGFSWIVDDIDPTYTLGDMARKRQEIIAALKEEGVFDLQHELSLPLFCQHIAVVSSATAAGYGDFCNQLADNELGLRFITRLFPATMQGEGVEQSVIAALDRINAEWEQWDCVVIIRGGGATSDLSGFDTLALAENVANFPLPVITGIGHDRDESVLDMLSFQRVKTPTAAAAFLVARLTEVYARIETARETVLQTVKRRFSDERHRLDHLAYRVETSAVGCLRDARHHLDMLEQRITSQDPALLLRRGYSITLKDGRAVRDASRLKSGDVVETRVEKGTFRSVVE